MTTESICALVRRTENSYVYRNTRIGKYVYWSMHETIETIDAYLNSKHLTGLKDSLGREKPFFNIVTAAANIWFRATNIDRKDIQILPDSSGQTALAFVATILLQNWMIKERFGLFLNRWGRTLARYGSAVCKFVEQDGTLVPTVIPWNRLIVDPIDFDALPTIEKLYITPAKLLENPLYDQEAVKGLIQAVTTRRNLERQPLDYQSDFLELYEVHGLLPTRLLDPEKGKDDEFRQQMHVVSFVMTKEGEYDNYTLYRGKEKKSPYVLTHLIPEDGRTLSIGAVEYLFDAQWMQNHTIKAQRDYLDLASKLIFQTSDSHFIGRNALSAIETGDILVHAVNQPLTQVSNNVQNITALEAFSNQWKVLTQDVTSTSDAMKGNTMPSGTPYALGALLNQQSGSLFEIMTENKGMYLENMLREFIIPFLKTQLNHGKEVAAILDHQGISQIDAMYVPREAVRQYNKKAIDQILKGPDAGIPSPFVQQDEEAQVKNNLSPLGNKRFLKPSDIKDKTWAEQLKDLEWTCRIIITDEMEDKQTMLTTLSTVLQSLATNPMILQDPNAKMLFAKILTLTGAVSPIELQPSTMQPQNGTQGNNSGSIPNSGSTTGKLAQINK